MNRGSDLNLASSPFVNRRPAVRLTILLWLIGLGLAAVNLTLFLSRPGASLTPQQQREVRSQIERERATIDGLRRDLARYDPSQINQLAQFINGRIAARTFAWSELFDDLAEAMPDNVRLVSLQPEFLRRDSKRESELVGRGGVLLQIRGVGRASGDVLEFVDRLFAHQNFRSANLAAERRQDGGEHEFALTVIYTARRMEERAEEAAAAGAGEGVPEEPPGEGAEDEVDAPSAAEESAP